MNGDLIQRLNDILGGIGKSDAQPLLDQLKAEIAKPEFLDILKRLGAQNPEQDVALIGFLLNVGATALPLLLKLISLIVVK